MRYFFAKDTLEEKIANAIWEEIDISNGYFREPWCTSHGFTEDEFEDFLQFGLDAMREFRLKNEYYEKIEDEK